MLSNFQEVLDKARKFGRKTISVAAAQDKEALGAVKAAYDQGLVQPILVGDANIIKPLMVEVGLPADTKVLHEPDMRQAALTAVTLVREGEAQILMKGLVNSSDFLRAVVNKECGLRTGRLLSHLAVFEVPGSKKLIFHTDGGMNVAPTLEEKKDILANGLLALQALGVKEPKVAVLAASEVVNPKVPATTDAKAIADLYASEPPYPAIVEGPIAMDVALNPEAAEHKGIKSKISGDVDLFLIPNIETGNAVGKAIAFYANIKIAGIILGATHPVVMISRADKAEAKLHSIALACLAAQ